MARMVKTRRDDIPQDTLLTRLKQDNTIPSRSWAYTAGSRWCEHGPSPKEQVSLMCFLASSNGSQGSLILGGYDETRMDRNDVVFPFDKDKLRLHTAWVERITRRARPGSGKQVIWPFPDQLQVPHRLYTAVYIPSPSHIR
jgi:hypothetical protein